MGNQLNEDKGTHHPEDPGICFKMTSPRQIVYSVLFLFPMSHTSQIRASGIWGVWEGSMESSQGPSTCDSYLRLHHVNPVKP